MIVLITMRDNTFYDKDKQSDRLCQKHQVNLLHFEAKSLCKNGFYHYFYCEKCNESINAISMDEIGNGHLLWEL